MFRCLEDGSYLQVFNIQYQRWVSCSLIWDLTPTTFDILQIINNLFHINSGGGSTAANASVESAVQWAVNKATNSYITYSQSNRSLNNPNGSSYDCSSFVITAFNQAGFNVSASTTRDMVDGFTAVGFSWHPYTSGVIPASDLQRGDILLNRENHTQMYIGNNQDVNCGSTPARVMEHNSNYWGEGWDGFLRYDG